MKYLFYILLFSISLNSYAQSNYKRLHIRMGKNAYRSDSKKMERSRGIASIKETENKITAKKIGNTYFYSNGTSTSKIGNTYYNSNGTYCNYTKTSVYCNY